MSIDWSLTAAQLSTLAYGKLGVLDANESMTELQWSRAQTAINAMLKGMQSKGINLYRQTRVVATVPALVGNAGNPFVLTPTILQFEQAWYQVNGDETNERMLGVFSYIDYMSLPNKLAQQSSGPSVVCFDKQQAQSNFYFWPLNPFPMNIAFIVARTVNDVSSPNDPLDFPTEWTEGMGYSLADRLMEDDAVAAADPATAERITAHAQKFIGELLDFDRPTSVFIRPYGRRGRGRFWR